MFVLSSDGVRIYYSVKKREGKPFLLLLHGLALSSECFNGLDLSDYSVLAIDFRGHGKSGSPENNDGFSLENCVSDVKLILSKEKIRQFSVLGFSMGGFVAALLSRDFNVKALLVNPLLSGDSIRFSFFVKVFFSLFVPRFFLKFFVKDKKIWVYKGLFDEYAKLLINTPRRSYWNFLLNSLNLSRLRPGSNCLVLLSSNDEVLNNKDLRGELIKSHHYVLAEQPEQVSVLLKKFIE